VCLALGRVAVDLTQELLRVGAARPHVMIASVPGGTAVRRWDSPVCRERILADELSVENLCCSQSAARCAGERRHGTH
jgi:hypothetical protein